MELEIYRSVAKGYNSLEYKFIEEVIADNFVYESQRILKLLREKEELLDYLKGKFEVIRESENPVFVEIGVIENYDIIRGQLRFLVRQGEYGIIKATDG